MMISMYWMYLLYPIWYHMFGYHILLSKCWNHKMISLHDVMLWFNALHPTRYQDYDFMSWFQDSALDIMLWNQFWIHEIIYMKQIFARKFAQIFARKFCCGFRGVAVHYTTGSSPSIRPSSPSSASSTASSPSPAKEARPALGAARTSGNKANQLTSFSWRNIL